MWVDKISKLVKKKRCNNEEIIIKNGYSILDTVKKLEKYYGGEYEKDSNV